MSDLLFRLVYYVPFLIADVLMIMLNWKLLKYVKKNHVKWSLFITIGFVGICFKYGYSILETLAGVFGWWAVG